MTNEIEIILVGIMVCACCTLPGVFLTLRGMTMMTDAISHTILLGVVSGYLISKDVSSPLVLIFSVLVGIITAFLIELFTKTKLLSKDSSIGIVFPLFFSLGVILVSKFAKDVHLDVEHIVFGEIAFTPFDRFETLNYDFGPKALVIASIIFIINLTLILLFYKQFKITTFDEDYSKIIGISPLFFHYLLMTMVSITSVGSFSSVGVVLVVSFMVGPAMTARLFTNKLNIMIILSIIIGGVCSTVGYLIARYLDVSISGMQATTVGVVFIVVAVIKINTNKIIRSNIK